MLIPGIAACHSPPSDSATRDREIRNRDETIAAQEARIRELARAKAAQARRIEELQAARRAAPGEPPGAAVRQLVARFRHDGDIKVEADGSGYRFLLRNHAIFRDDSARLSEAGEAALGRIAAELRLHPHPVLIEGHTDDAPIGEPEVLRRFPRGNIELSTRRALAVWQYLVETGKVPRGRLSVAGYGPNRPRAPNDTSLRRRENSRTEIVVELPAANKGG